MAHKDTQTWDVFISHAWEDKEPIARPLAKALEAKGLKVWFDEVTLRVGDGLRRSIDNGLAHSTFGIVILSPNFFAKDWPQKELDGMVAREINDKKVILPVWHNITSEQIRSYSPMLADRIAVSSDNGLEHVVTELLRAIRRVPGNPVSSDLPNDWSYTPIPLRQITSNPPARARYSDKQRIKVREQNHTLILGWSSKVFTLISELIEANLGHKNHCIVILADQDKLEMEGEIRAKILNTKNTRIVCSSGSPLDPTDLAIVNANSARSIIVVAPQVDDPDTYVIKTLLAITNHPRRKTEPYQIVTEIRDEKNLQVAKMVGRDEAQIVLADDLLSRITVQMCRQSGLSVVYTELLNFGGDEIYFKNEPSLVGKTFGETLSVYEDSAVIGLQTKDGTRVNPPMDTKLASGDQIIVIAEDDDKIKLSGMTNLGIDEKSIQTKKSTVGMPEKTLILGWNRKAPSIISQLDQYVAVGSQATVVSNVADAAKQIGEMRFQSVKFIQAKITDRAVLDRLNVQSFDHIIVLSYADTLDAGQADAQTLITLLHLRDISEKSGNQLSIVSEMLDVRNRELAEFTRADDFIVSDQLISLLLAQVSENKYLNAVFADLFDPEGSNIYLKPASDYVRLDAPVNFYTVLEAARQRGEVAIGYRIKSQAHDAGKLYGVAVNPDKSNKVIFTQGDKIIVLAES